MTPLRDNLDRAKAGYEQTRYRGDLARDVLGAMPIDAAPADRTMNLWPRRAMAIAAAIVLSTTTFFAGRYLEQRASTNVQVAEVTPAKSTPDVNTPDQTQTETAVAEAPAEAFTLVPSLASANTSSTDTQVASAEQLSSQQPMDFSMSVPSAPMLFSLATLAEEETQQISTDGETEERS